MSVYRTKVIRAVQSHDHDFLEIVLVVSGRASHATVYGRRELRRGDLIVIKPRAWHEYAEPRDLVVWNCCIAPAIIGEPGAWLGHGNPLHALLRYGGDSGQRRRVIETRLAGPTARRFDQALAALSDARAGSLEMAGRLLLFLHLVVEQLGLADDPMADERSHPAAVAAAQLLEGRVQSPWTLEELSSRVGLDKSYLVRLFKREIGVGPIDYLIGLRCERAAGLLLTTSEPVGQIGYRVGWDDPNYFARRFRRHFGQSPSAYRAMMSR